MPLDIPLNSGTEKLPPVEQALILWLRGVFPDKMPEIDDDLETVRYKQGQLSVDRALASIHEELSNVSV
jgi:hypothetical protein